MVTQAVVPFRQKDELDIQTLGAVFVKSGFFQDSHDASQAITKILAGRELGIGPMAAMTGIFVVKGRVSLSANLIAALIKRSGRYDYRVKRLDNEACSIVFTEGGEVIGESTFTRDDAKAAKLGGDNWSNYPRNMLFARAMSNGAKWFAPDLFGGPLYTPDELGAATDAESGEPLIDLRTGEVLDGEVLPEAVKPSAGLSPQLRKALADWAEEDLRARANGIEPLARDIDTATYDELRESSTRLLKLRGAATELGWPQLFADAMNLGLEPAPLAEVSSPRQLRERFGGLSVVVARKQKERAEAGEEGPAPAAIKPLGVPEVVDFEDGVVEEEVI